MPPTRRAERARDVLHEAAGSPSGTPTDEELREAAQARAEASTEARQANAEQAQADAAAHEASIDLIIQNRRARRNP